MSEVQKHGFSWEKQLMKNIYKISDDEIENIGYTDKVDLPARFNKLDGCDVSIKTTGSPNSVCMADCLRVFDSVNGNNKIHLTVVLYKQTVSSKIVDSIVEIDLTNSSKELFGCLTREQIEELDKLVKSVPQKRKPTNEEHSRMYELKNKLQSLSGAIRLDIKCNSTQSRLQCSFNKFQDFINQNPERVVSKSSTCEFRGGSISSEIVSQRRIFKKRLNSEQS